METFLLSGIGISIFAILLFFFFAGAWATFEKAGEKGWKSIIPIYNLIILLKIVDKPWWWILLYLIPGIGFIIHIVVIHLLSLSFGKGFLYTVGLYFLSPLFYLLLGFRKSAQYIGPGGVA